METDLERRAEQIFDQTLDAPVAGRRAAAIARLPWRRGPACTCSGAACR